VTLGTHLGQDDIRTGGTIVGVIDDTREGAVDRPSRPTLYVPHAQDPTSVVSIVVRGAGRTPDAAAVRTVINGLDPDVPLFRVRTTGQLASTVVAQPRLLTALMSLFAAAALLVAGIGLYGLLAQSVAARAREIGVRRVVGATASDVAALIAAHTGQMVGLGAIVGVVASWAASSVLDRFVFGQRGPDVVAYAAAIAALAGLATLAAAVPCRRALAVDPAVTLRSE
jgi:predicted lysophospholipase L1 biosynthesis ABC-type transport system permease subunit